MPKVAISVPFAAVSGRDGGLHSLSLSVTGITLTRVYEELSVIYSIINKTEGVHTITFCTVCIAGSLTFY